MSNKNITISSQINSDNSSTSYDVVIVNYKSSDLLVELLADLAHATPPPARVSVVDNNSNDKPERIRKLFPEIILLQNPVNFGFARAANQGWKLGLSPIVLFINPDTRLLDQDFSAVLKYLSDQPQVAAVGPCILDSDGTVQGSARGFHNYLTLLAGRKGPLTKLFPKSSVVRRDLPLLASDGVTPIKVDWLSGACMFAKRKALEQVGGFDQRYFLYFEDTDLCRRFKDHGWSVYYLPFVRITHQVGQSSQKRPLRSLWWFHRSWYRYMCRHHFPANPFAQMISAQIVGICFALRATAGILSNLLKKH